MIVTIDDRFSIEVEPLNYILVESYVSTVENSKTYGKIQTKTHGYFMTMDGALQKLLRLELDSALTPDTRLTLAEFAELYQKIAKDVEHKFKKAADHAKHLDKKRIKD